MTRGSLLAEALSLLFSGASARSALALALVFFAVHVSGQDARFDRDEMFRRYSEFPTYVKGGRADPHWQKDGSTFWYAATGESESVTVRQELRNAV